MPTREHHLEVTRTARYFTVGEPGPEVRQVWFALHGHGQLAAHFIRPFAELDDGTRYILAPEGLSRYYVEPTSWGRAGLARVGATWMTREDRLNEISDYVRYLDSLYAHVFATLARESVQVALLGFSQGVATACRWACRGSARVDRLILWAGPLPPELGEEADRRRLAAMRVVRVLGEQDEYAREQLVSEEDQRFTALGVEAPLVRFPGGHQIDPATLLELAR